MWGGSDDAEAIRTIHAALEQGINVIDTAAVYGFGHAEELVGKALADGHRQQVLIATKVGLAWRDGKVYWDSSPARLRRELEESLRRLQTDVIDVYQVHWPDKSVKFETTAAVRHSTRAPTSATMRRGAFLVGSLHSAQRPHRAWPLLGHWAGPSPGSRSTSSKMASSRRIGTCFRTRLPGPTPSVALRCSAIGLPTDLLTLKETIDQTHHQRHVHGRWRIRRRVQPCRGARRQSVMAEVSGTSEWGVIPASTRFAMLSTISSDRDRAREERCRGPANRHHPVSRTPAQCAPEHASGRHHRAMS